MEYDAIIAGASFAGLTVASSLTGNILLIDRKPVGTLPISACATTQSLLTGLGLKTATTNKIDRLLLHVGDSRFEHRLDPPWCTFDYQSFCHQLFERFDGKFVQANIRGFKKSAVITDFGDYSARCIIDCSGWKARLATSVDPGFYNPDCLGFAMEAITDLPADCFHFFHDQRIIKRGIAWIFPYGKGSRIGIGSYANDQLLRDDLDAWLKRLEAHPLSYSGGIIPWKIRRPVKNGLFVVGDAAGMVLAVLGEGIRPSIFFARECARYVQKVIDGTQDLETALVEYNRFVEDNRRRFELFTKGQKWIATANEDKLRLVAKILSIGLWSGTIQNRFGKAYSFK